jgi:hypothetical protein
MGMNRMAVHDYRPAMARYFVPHGRLTPRGEEDGGFITPELTPCGDSDDER